MENLLYLPSIIVVVFSLAILWLSILIGQLKKSGSKSVYYNEVVRPRELDRYNRLEEKRNVAKDKK